ncbi:hypothetical protein C8F04DRAFT_1252125 [Mycena alexandri]|uniref:Uncharacterized protein n=1 Tax=Mycena alexandri TaxID=1745969 RepID=A0AAD6T939_9AGAR|nr:hypothetical protein C8F04DRAFT_1252125 [Mycena alexandri]
MSLLIESLTASNFSFAASPRTKISSVFYNNLALTNKRTRLLVTTFVPGHINFSVHIDVEVVTNLHHDVVLGLEWSSYVRQVLIDAGYRLPNTFDSWLFFSHSEHPILAQFDGAINTSTRGSSSLLPSSLAAIPSTSNASRAPRAPPIL